MSASRRHGFGPATSLGWPASACARAGCAPRFRRSDRDCVAAIVAVLGLSASSQTGLLAEINQLGTNLLDVTTGQNFSGQGVPLPLAAPGTIGRIGPVYDVAYTGTIANTNAYRTPLIHRSRPTR